VFRKKSGAVAVGLMLLPTSPAAADVTPQTLAAWHRHIAGVEAQVLAHPDDPPVVEPQGHTVSVEGGSIHEWRGSVVIKGITVSDLVRALESPGLPPPAEDILDARVLGKEGQTLRVYMKVSRTALITVTYDTEHDVTFAQPSPNFATSRSVSTRIQETGGSDRGFLWRLNSYWRYRQSGNDVVVDVLSESLSRDVPALARPIAAPLIDRIARDSMRRTLNAVERFGNNLHVCTGRPAVTAR